MIHKRCAIRDLLDEGIAEWSAKLDEEDAEPLEVAAAFAALNAYKEVRLAIFDELPD